MTISYNGAILAAPGGVQVLCSCGACLGEVVEVEGVPLLHAGGLLLDIAGGVCIHCGRAFHRSASREVLSELYRRRKRAAGKM